MLSIHKEIEKKNYSESPLGVVEKKLTRIYDDLRLQKEKFPEDLSKKIHDIRDANEKWQMKYIEDSLREQREKVDEKLLEAMTEELNLIQSHGY